MSSDEKDPLVDEGQGDSDDGFGDWEAPPPPTDSLEKARAHVEAIEKKIHNDHPPDFVGQFHSLKREQEVALGHVPLRTVQDAEAEETRRYVQRRRRKRQQWLARARKLREREIEARQRAYEEQRRNIDMAEGAGEVRSRDDIQVMHGDDIHAAFEAVGSEATKLAREERGYVEAHFGSLGTRPWKDPSYWKRKQLVEIQIKSLRVVKNKLMAGKYGIMVTLFDRLGGWPVKRTRKHSTEKLGVRKSGGNAGGGGGDGIITSDEKAAAVADVLQNEFGTRKGARGSGTGGALDVVNADEEDYADDGDMYYDNDYYDDGGEDASGGYYEDAAYEDHMDDAHTYTYFGATETPFQHQGKFNNLEMRFAEDGSNSIFISVPSPSNVRPSMVLIFELFQLADLKHDYDKVVGWGAFPLCDSSLNVCEGPFRAPFLRGPRRPNMERYVDMERVIRDDVDNWLCNCYFIMKNWSAGTGEVDPIGAEKEAKAALERATAKINDATGKLSSEKMAKMISCGGLPDLSHHRVAVSPIETSAPTDVGTTKLKYVLDELRWDLFLSRKFSWQFVLSTAMILMCFICAIHLRYLGVWLFFDFCNVPVYNYTTHVFTVRYDVPENPEPSALNEAIPLIMGQMTLAIILAFLILFTAASQRCFGVYTSGWCRLTVVWGILTLLSPFYTIFIDAVASHSAGDYFKVTRYSSARGQTVSGVVATFLTVVIMESFVLAMFYMYLLRVHMNGRALDLYRRLHGQEHIFAIPEDTEISLRVLEYILSTSRDWQGLQGTQRRVMVSAHTLYDVTDANYEEADVHIAIYNVTSQLSETAKEADKQARVPGLKMLKKSQPSKKKLKGARSSAYKSQKAMGEQSDVHRHFLRRGDGTILELFGPTVYSELTQRWMGSADAALAQIASRPGTMRGAGPLGTARASARKQSQSSSGSGAVGEGSLTGTATNRMHASHSRRPSGYFAGLVGGDINLDDTKKPVNDPKYFTFGS